MSFPNQISDPKPTRPVLTSAGGRLTLLFLLALALRAGVAARIEVGCRDGLFHIGKAERIEQGTAHADRDGYDLNTYPLILSAWRRAGLDWETAAKIWGVLAGGLTVLPLFGWVRRMFDDRVAFVAGALYATHGKLAEWSPEAVRDPTYWLLVAVWLYCAWRAVTEVHRGWYFAAGCATFLAAQTRFEGWLLLLPLLAWSAWRWLSLRQARWRLMGGVAICLLSYPLVLSGLAYLYGYHEGWELGRSHRVQMAVEWLQAHTGISLRGAVVSATAMQPQSPPAGETAPAVAAAEVHPTEHEPSPDTSEERPGPLAVWTSHRTLATGLIVMEKVFRASTPVFGLLVLLGLARWWRLLVRADALPLVIFALGTLSAVWIFSNFAQNSSTRYLLSLVLLATPLASLGLFAACRQAAGLAAWMAPRAAPRPWVAAGLFLLVLGVGGGQALMRGDVYRRSRVQLGQWLGERLGPQATIAGQRNWKAASRYAHGEFHQLPAFAGEITPELFSRVVDTVQPDAAILPQYAPSGPLAQFLTSPAVSAEFEIVDAAQLPPSCRKEVTVLLRRSPHVARRSP